MNASICLNCCNSVRHYGGMALKRRLTPSKPPAGPPLIRTKNCHWIFPKKSIRRSLFAGISDTIFNNPKANHATTHNYGKYSIAVSEFAIDTQNTRLSTEYWWRAYCVAQIFFGSTPILSSRTVPSCVRVWTAGNCVYLADFVTTHSSMNKKWIFVWTTRGVINAKRYCTFDAL